MPTHSASNFKLLLRSLIPSSFSLMVSFIITILISGGHMLLITLNGKALPVFLDEQAMQAYITTVIDPLLQITTNITFNNGLSILLWAVFGWLIYTLIALIANNVSDIKSAKQQVRFNGSQTVQSPMHHSLMARILWRFCVIILLVIGTIFATKIMHVILMNDYRILASSSLSEILWLLGVNLITWMVILHGYVVLLRWYALRTRVFGEIIF